MHARFVGGRGRRPDPQVTHTVGTDILVEPPDFGAVELHQGLVPRAVPGQLQLVPPTRRNVARSREPASSTPVQEYPALGVDLDRKTGIAREPRQIVMVGEGQMCSLESR